MKIGDVNFNIRIEKDHFYFERSDREEGALENLEKIEKILARGLVLDRKATQACSHMSMPQVTFLLKDKAIEICKNNPQEKNEQIEELKKKVIQLAAPKFLQEMPNEVVQEIVKYLSLSDLYALHMTSKRFTENVEEFILKKIAPYVHEGEEITVIPARLHDELNKLDEKHPLQKYIIRDARGKIDLEGTLDSIRAIPDDSFISTLSSLSAESFHLKNLLSNLFKEKRAAEVFLRRCVIDALNNHYDTLAQVIPEDELKAVWSGDGSSIGYLTKGADELHDKLVAIGLKILENREVASKVFEGQHEWLKDEMQKAIQKNQLGLLPLLLTLDTHGYTHPLHLAIQLGSLEAVKYLVEAGYSVALEDEKGNFPLHLAAKLGSLEIVNYLLEQGADSYQVDREGKTPLLYALGNYRLEPEIVSRGPVYGYGESPFMEVHRDPPIFDDVACLLAFWDPLGAEELLNLLSYPMDETPELKRALIKAANDNVAIMEEYCNHDPQAFEEFLTYAIIYEDIEVVETLLQFKPEGILPLHIAASVGSFKLVAHLALLGYDINEQDSEGKTPLMHAVIRSPVQGAKFNQACSSFLSQINADPAIKDFSGKTFEDYFRENVRNDEEWEHFGSITMKEMTDISIAIEDYQTQFSEE